MPNQKGSLKDRIRSWNLFLKYKLKLLKQKRELKKIEREKNKKTIFLATGKYYSKPKVFGLTILGLFLGFFEPKSKRQEKAKDIELKIIKLEQKVKIGVLSKQDIVELNRIEKQISISKYSKNNNEVEKIYFSNYESRINNIKAELNKKTSHSEVKEDNEKKDLRVEEKKEIDTNNLTSNKKVVGFYIPILEIKKFNKDLKQYKKDLQDYNQKISNENNYNNLYEPEFLIKQLKIKLKNLLIQYDNLKDLPGFSSLSNISDIMNIDFNDLRKSNKRIIEQIAICDSALEKIETRKSEINNKNEKKAKEIVKEDVKKEEKKEIKNKDKKEEDKAILEILVANRIICDKIAQEQRKIAKFQRSISKVSIRQKRHSIFYYSKNFVSSILNFGFSLFPLSLFKNKFLGGIVSGIMLNNSLRSARRILNPDIEIDYMIYHDLEREISSTENYLNKMDYLCSDSLRQVNNIRTSLYTSYGNEIEYSISLQSYLTDLDRIESKIRLEQEKIISLNDNLENVRIKNRQKIKRMEVR